MATASGDVIRCQCGAKLRIPANAAGRRVRCPKCEFKILIPADGAPVQQSTPARAASRPAPSRAASPRPAPTPAPDEGDSLLDDFMQLESGAETASGPDLASSQKSCPSCKAAMAKDARTCPMCGWEPGKANQAEPPSAATKSEVRKLAVGGGKFALGCTLSAGGALLGAGIWYGVAVATHVEIGFIAWAVGLFAGFGMLLGYGKQDMIAAVIATAMALGGIFTAKGFIYDHLYGSMVNYTDSTRAVVSHWADRQCSDSCQRRGLPDWSDECLAECDTSGEDLFEMADGPFEIRRAELDHWANEERWQDPGYARMVLAHHYANDAATEVTVEDANEEDWDEDGWNEEAELAKWRTQYEAALVKVDALPEDQRLTEAQRVEKEAEEEYVQFAENMASLLKDFDGGFFNEMFSPIDGLFVLLALGTALKIGGGQED